MDLAPQIGPAAAGRALREAIRLKLTTAARVRVRMSRDQRRRGTALLGELAARYSMIPYGRARSDAESRALEILHEAGVPPPRVNTRIAGEEADLAWPDKRLIVEIDGPQYHQFPD